MAKSKFYLADNKLRETDANGPPMVHYTGPAGIDMTITGTDAEGIGSLLSVKVTDPKYEIPEDLAQAIREAVAANQTPEQVGMTFGDALIKLGVPWAKILALAASGAQVLEFLGIRP